MSVLVCTSPRGAPTSCAYRSPSPPASTCAGSSRRSLSPATSFNSLSPSPSFHSESSLAATARALPLSSLKFNHGSRSPAHSPVRASSPVSVSAPWSARGLPVAPGSPRSASPSPPPTPPAEATEAPPQPPLTRQRSDPSDGRRAPTLATPRVHSAGSSGASAAIAPGDVFFVRGSGGIADIGTTGGFMGHVLVVLAAPQPLRPSDKADIQSAMPSINTSRVWRVSTLESTRGCTGLHTCEMLLHVQPKTGRFSFVGELSSDGSTLTLVDNEAVELWQSPADLRSQLRVDIMAQVLAEMKGAEQSWSYATAARAMFKSAALRGSKNRATLLHEMQECWDEAPICTSIVVIFWQRYLCHFAQTVGQRELDLVLKWMPLFADRGLPGDLTSSMRKCGWNCLDKLKMSSA